MFRHHFSIWIQLWWSLCNTGTILPHYMIWVCSSTIFQYEFNRGDHYVMQRLFLSHHMIWVCSGTIFQYKFDCDDHYVMWGPFGHIIWYGYVQTLFFKLNSVVVVITHYGRQIWHIIWYGHHCALFLISHSIIMHTEWLEDYFLTLYNISIIWQLWW